MLSNTSTNAYTLHIIFSMSGWQSAQPFIESDDKVIFIQDAVYFAQQLQQAPHSLYARSVDIKARNIQPDPHIEVIDDEQWVNLTDNARNTASW